MAALRDSRDRLTKVLDSRHTTRGGLIRLEAWMNSHTKQVVKYNLAYVNHHFPRDNGRLLGFDNDHLYPGFTTLHHCHWHGRVYEDQKFVSFTKTLDRFQRHLMRLKRTLGRNY